MTDRNRSPAMERGDEAHGLATRPKIVGARVKRTEDARLLVGKGTFVDDRRVPGVLHVAFRRSDHSHALIGQIDCEDARNAPGVVAVFTAADTVGINALLATSRMKDYHATPITALARDKVRYVGEPVVAVVAESRYRAEDAIELINIEFAPLAVVIDPEQAAKPSAPLLHEDAGTNVLCTREFKTGDVDQTIAAAAVRVSGRFRFRRKSPLAMENRTYLAEYDVGRDELTLHSSTQVPGIIRDALSEALAIAASAPRASEALALTAARPGAEAADDPGDGAAARGLILYSGTAEWQQHSAQVGEAHEHFASLKVQLLSDGPLALFAQQLPGTAGRNQTGPA